jgi:hypothetical protein
MTDLTPEQRRAIARQARADGSALSSADLPSEADLSRMSLVQMLDVLATYGVTIDEERLDADVRAALATDTLLIDRGTELGAARRQALVERTQRTVANVARSVANQTMGDMRQTVMDEADTRPEDERWQMWVTVSDKKNCCPDCRDLHGMVGRPDYWDGIAPRDGNTICKGNCKCSLVPCGAPSSGEDGTYATRR